MFDSIRGVIRFEASGGRLYGFINAIRGQRLICRGQRMRGECFMGDIYLSDRGALELLAQENGVELKYVEKRGLIFRLLRYRLRYGITVGLAIAMSLAFWLSNVVLQIEITGLDASDERILLRELESLGIKNGAFIPALDLPMCEKLLEERLDNISWTGIHRSGCRISVQADEMTDTPEMRSGVLPCNIVAKCDAQITSVSVLCGNLVPIVGDAVKKGDVLISGIKQDHKGNTLVRRARGSVTGIYTESISFEQPFTETVSEYNGKSTAYRALRIVSLDLPLYIGGMSDAKCEASEAYEPFCFLGAKLPFGLKTTRCKYLSETENNYTEDEAKLLINDKIVLYERNFYKDVKLLDREITYSSGENSVYSTVKYRLEGEIGKEYEILIKN